jgi:hypothetical protein
LLAGLSNSLLEESKGLIFYRSKIKLQGKGRINTHLYFLYTVKQYVLGNQMTFNLPLFGPDSIQID